MHRGRIPRRRGGRFTPWWVSELEVDQPQPVKVLEPAGSAVLGFIAAQHAQIETVRERGGNSVVEFDRVTGRLRLGGLLEVAACEVGTFDPSAMFLSRAAMPPEETRGGWLVPAPVGEGTTSVAVTDPEAPWVPSLPGLCEAIEDAADILQPLVHCAHRYAVMKSMVYGYFERVGLVGLHIGEPHVFIGQRGLHEVQVAIAHDGTINGARTAPAHEWLSTATATGLIWPPGNVRPTRRALSTSMPPSRVSPATTLPPTARSPGHHGGLGPVQ
jgi:hypothetical protein